MEDCIVTCPSSSWCEAQQDVAAGGLFCCALGEDCSDVSYRRPMHCFRSSKQVDTHQYDYSISCRLGRSITPATSDHIVRCCSRTKMSRKMSKKRQPDQSCRRRNAIVIGYRHSYWRLGIHRPFRATRCSSVYPVWNSLAYVRSAY